MLIENRNVNKNIKRAYIVIVVAFCLYITLWSTFFMQKWKIYEMTFATRYGVTQLEHQDEVRTSFKGTFQRNPVTDKINSIGNVIGTHKRKALAVVIITLMLIIGSFASSYALLYKKRQSFNKRHTFIAGVY